MICYESACTLASVLLSRAQHIKNICVCVVVCVCVWWWGSMWGVGGVLIVFMSEGWARMG